MKKIFLILFIVASVAELISEIANIPMLYYISKPLIMATLIGYYAVISSVRSIVVIAAMFFSLVGDVLLMNPAYFIPGLVAFLISHVVYIIAYRQHRDEYRGDPLTGVHRARMAFPIILAGSGLVFILYPSLGDLKIPVIVYAGVISFMALTALFRYGTTNAKSFWLVFTGAILFMMSDSILAANKFLAPISNGGLWIMLTYITAQFAIVNGLLHHER
jgi:uncharacterized membrane protein YhhN